MTSIDRLQALMNSPDVGTAPRAQPADTPPTDSASAQPPAETVAVSETARHVTRAIQAVTNVRGLLSILGGGGSTRWSAIAEQLNQAFDTIVLASADFTIFGSSGRDFIKTSSGAEIDAGAGDDVVEAWSNSKVNGGIGNDLLMAWSDSDIAGGDGDDSISAWSGAHVDGGDGDDAIKAWSDSVVDGGAGDDAIDAWSNAIVDGGAGNDMISVGANSVVKFDRGSGQDVVAAIGGTNIHIGAGLNAAQMTVAFDGNDVKISFSDSGDSITLRDGASSFGRTQLIFADGSTVDVATRLDDPATFTTLRASRFGGINLLA